MSFPPPVAFGAITTANHQTNLIAGQNLSNQELNAFVNNSNYSADDKVQVLTNVFIQTTQAFGQWAQNQEERTQVQQALTAEMEQRIQELTADNEAIHEEAINTRQQVQELTVANEELETIVQQQNQTIQQLDNNNQQQAQTIALLVENNENLHDEALATQQQIQILQRGLNRHDTIFELQLACVGAMCVIGVALIATDNPLKRKVKNVLLSFHKNDIQLAIRQNKEKIRREAQTANTAVELERLESLERFFEREQIRIADGKRDELAWKSLQEKAKGLMLVPLAKCTQYIAKIIENNPQPSADSFIKRLVFHIVNHYLQKQRTIYENKSSSQLHLEQLALQQTQERQQARLKQLQDRVLGKK